MSAATKLHSSANEVSEPRSILGPGGNRVRVSEEPKRKKEGLKPLVRTKKTVSEIRPAVVRNNVSVDSSCSSDSSTCGYAVKGVNSTTVKSCVSKKPVKVVETLMNNVSGPKRQCDWITQYSDPLYASFHNEEWGVPVYDDRMLFELLVFSQTLAEMNWPAILNKRDLFRKFFDNFEPSSVAKFTEKKLQSLTVNGSLLLSEQKLRAIVENAKQMLKIQLEFGSFSNYIWRFINHIPIRNGFRYARQVPVKTPKAEFISKDLMRRGFRCVGPTVIYSFMQVAGIVNDHLVTCLRYQECNSNVTRDVKANIENTEVITKALENTSLSARN